MIDKCAKHFKTPRYKLSSIIVSKNRSALTRIRQVLLRCGFDDIYTLSSYLNALTDASDRKPSLVFFDADTPPGSEISVVQFVENIQKILDYPIMIAIVTNPSSENLFELLKVGIKGFLVPPFTSEAIENVFSQIKEGFHLSEEVLYAENRFAAFSKLIQEQLDRCTLWMENNIDNAGSEDLLEQQIQNLRETIKTAQFFCHDEEGTLAIALQEAFLAHAQKIDELEKKTRLRRTRERLQKERKNKDEE